MIVRKEYMSGESDSHRKDMNISRTVFETNGDENLLEVSKGIKQGKITIDSVKAQEGLE